MKSLEMNIIYENPIPQLRSRQAALKNLLRVSVRQVTCEFTRSFATMSILILPRTITR